MGLIVGPHAWNGFHPGINESSTANRIDDLNQSLTAGVETLLVIGNEGLELRIIS